MLAASLSDQVYDADPDRNVFCASNTMRQNATLDDQRRRRRQQRRTECAKDVLQVHTSLQRDNRDADALTHACGFRAKHPTQAKRAESQSCSFSQRVVVGRSIQTTFAHVQSQHLRLDSDKTTIHNFSLCHYIHLLTVSQTTPINVNRCDVPIVRACATHHSNRRIDSCYTINIYVTLGIIMIIINYESACCKRVECVVGS
jgi:hypothetical protein